MDLCTTDITYISWYTLIMQHTSIHDAGISMLLTACDSQNDCAAFASACSIGCQATVIAVIMNVKVRNDKIRRSLGASPVFLGPWHIDSAWPTGCHLLPHHSKNGRVSGSHRYNACKGNICSNHSRVAVLWCNNRRFG